MKILLDAMSGDKAPVEIVKGAAMAKARLGVTLTLVGQREVILRCARENGISLDGIRIEHAEGIITMEDDPISVVRAKRIFGADKITIISQAYHVKRAVATARHMNIDAEGYCAVRIPFNRPTLLRQFMRERAARVAMVFDLLVGAEPHHMGNQIALPL